MVFLGLLTAKIQTTIQFMMCQHDILPWILDFNDGTHKMMKHFVKII